MRRPVLTVRLQTMRANARVLRVPKKNTKTTTQHFPQRGDYLDLSYPKVIPKSSR